MSDDRFETGMAVRRHVLGDAHVDRAESGKTDFDGDFQRWITETAWDGVWTRPGLPQPTRSLLTLVILASLGHWEEFAMHVRASTNTGMPRDELKEALFHVAVYAGIPAANRAHAIAKQTFAEMDAS